MAHVPAEKWKAYANQREFERGKAKMWAEGWVIAEGRALPGKAPYTSTGNAADLLMVPIAWLFNRTQPKEYLHVKYVRPR